MPSISSFARSRAAGRVLLLAFLIPTICCQSHESVAQSPAPVASGQQASDATAQPRQGEEKLQVVGRSSGKPEIDIDAIVADVQIAGHVTGLASQAASKYRVFVYVHTDQWYIHPYAGQGEGASWAKPNTNLHWEIPSVKRPFTADRVAALLVPSDVDPPARLGALGEFHGAIAWVVVKGNGQV